MANVVSIWEAPRGEGPESDAALIQGCLRGERAAKEAFCRRHLRDLRAFVYRQAPGDSELDDVVQETLIKALDRLETLEKPDSVKSWLRGIAINHLRHRFRRRRLARTFGLVRQDGSEHVILAPDVPPDIATELKAIYRCLDRLSADCRIALVLRRVEGLSMPEVAHEMGLSLATAKRRVASADAELRGILGPEAMS